MVKQNRHNLLKSQSDFHSLVASGIIPISISGWLIIYDFYKAELLKNDKSTSIQFTADNFKCTIQNIYKIISFMET